MSEDRTAQRELARRIGQLAAHSFTAREPSPASQSELDDMAHRLGEDYGIAPRTVAARGRMTVGRKPKAPLLKLITGNPGRRPIAPEVVVDPNFSNEITPPKKLRKRQAELWTGVTLGIWIGRYGFPAGRLVGPNTRLWDEVEVASWLASRPTKPKSTPLSPRARIAERDLQPGGRVISRAPQN